MIRIKIAVLHSRLGSHVLEMGYVFYTHDLSPRVQPRLKLSRAARGQWLAFWSVEVGSILVGLHRADCARTRSCQGAVGAEEEPPIGRGLEGFPEEVALELGSEGRIGVLWVQIRGDKL